MSIKNNLNLMTSEQLRRKLESLDTDKPEIKRGLLNFVTQLQFLDKITERIGLKINNFSFVNRVSWDEILSKLTNSKDAIAEEIKIDQIQEVISQSTDQLANELVPKLQRLRNNWMLEVILIDFVILALLTLVVAAVTHIQGLWNLSNISFPVQPLLYERPIFSLTILVLGFVGFFFLHFKVRVFVAQQLVNKLRNEKSEFNFAGAFLKNTRIWHSIFRPDIIGWNGFVKNKLLKEKG